MSARWFLAFVGLASSCASATPSVESDYTMASRHMFRGVPQVAGAVLQGDTSVCSPVDGQSALTATAWTSVNLSNESGDSLFPSGSGGKISQVDFVVDYTRCFGDTSVSAGGVSYNFPNTLFPSTTEAYGSVCLGGLPLAPTLTAYYDFDEVEGLYVNAGISHTVALPESLVLDLGLNLGWMDEQQGLVYYGIRAGGLADLVASGALSIPVGGHWAATLGVFASTVLDGDLEDSLGTAGIEADNLWAAVSLGMTY